MTGLAKGSDDPILLTQTETLDALGISPLALGKIVTGGYLNPIKRRKSTLFRAKDVYELAKSLRDRTTLSGVHHLAVSAMAVGQRTERLLHELLQFFGCRYEPLSIRSEDIEAFYRSIENTVVISTLVLDPTEVMAWARAFLKVKAIWLDAVKTLTGRSEPWQPLIEAADRLLLHAPRDQFKLAPDLAEAYGLLDYARNQLRQEAYLYCRGTSGLQAAGSQFPDFSSKDINQSILSLL